MTDPAPEPGRKSFRDVGGTKGGIGEFLLGLALLIAGGYLFLDHVTVSSPGAAWGRWSFFGYSPFGLTLIPMFIGVALLFFNGRSLAGWILTGGGLVAIFVGIISHLHIWFRPTSLLETLIMLALMAAGIGLVARAMKAH